MTRAFRLALVGGRLAAYGSPQVVHTRYQFHTASAGKSSDRYQVRSRFQPRIPTKFSAGSRLAVTVYRILCHFPGSRFQVPNKMVLKHGLCTKRMSRWVRFELA